MMKGDAHLLLRTIIVVLLLAFIVLSFVIIEQILTEQLYIFLKLDLFQVNVKIPRWPNGKAGISKIPIMGSIPIRGSNERI